MLVVITAFAALGGFLFGYDLGLIGPALLTYQRTNDITDFQKESIIGAAKLGSVLGTFIGGAVMLHYGRRNAIALDSTFFIIGPAIMAASAPVWGLIIGRLLIGVGIGISAVVVPAYLGEVAPARARGRIVEMYELLLCFGMVAAQLCDLALDQLPSSWSWRVMFGMPAVFGFIMLVATVILPESPRWLVVEGKLDEALRVIHRVYTNSTLPSGVHQSRSDVEHELMMLWSAVERERAAAIERRQALMYRMRRKVKRGGDKSSRRKAKGVGGWGWGWGRRRHLEEAEEGQVALEATTARVLGSDIIRSDADEQNGHSTMDDATQNGGSLHEAVRLDSTGSGAAIELTHVPSTEESEVLHDVDTGEGSHEAHMDGKGVTGHVDGNGVNGSGADRVRNHPRRSFFVVFGYMLLDIWLVAQGSERHAFWLALVLAFLNQATASTAIINYAPDVLNSMGVTDSTVNTLLTVSVTASKFVGIVIALALVDVWGRRPLLILGSFSTCTFMILAAVAYWVSSVALMVVAMDTFILAFSMSWAGIFWVLMSELFSMEAKAPALSAAIALLFLAGATVDFVFLTLLDALSGASFIIYATLAFLAGIVVLVFLPETKGRSLTEIQDLLAGGRRGAAQRDGSGVDGRAITHAGPSEVDSAAIVAPSDADPDSAAASSRSQGASWPSIHKLVAKVKPGAGQRKFTRMEEDQGEEAP